MGSRWRALGAILVVGLCLTGCSVLHDSAAKPSPTRAALQIYDRSGRDNAAFSSPGGNIACQFTKPSTANSSGTVRCEIAVKLWTPPPKPSSCDVDWGLGLTLDTTAQVLCAGDTVRLATSPIQLPYGTSIRFTPFTCASQPAGIDCVNTVSRASFEIGRERYEVRNP